MDALPHRAGRKRTTHDRSNLPVTLRRARDEGEFYFKIQVLMILASVVFYVVVISWMSWCLSRGSGYEFSVVPLVSCIMLAIMLTATRSMVVIACDGRPKARQVGINLTQPKRVSVDQWTIRSASGRDKLLK